MSASFITQCPHCLTSFRVNQAQLGAANGAVRCGACLADPPPFDRARAAVAYGPIARALALKLKYGRRPGIALTMARPMLRVGRIEREACPKCCFSLQNP